MLQHPSERSEWSETDHPFSAKLLMLRLDRKVVKRGATFVSDVEKALQHTHRERLSETAGSCKKRHLIRGFFDKIVYEFCFIHIVPIALDQFVEIVGTKQDLFQHAFSPPSEVTYPDVYTTPG